MDQDAEFFATAEEFTEVRDDSGKNLSAGPVSYEQTINQGD
jgi:hypothetical protein